MSCFLFELGQQLVVLLRAAVELPFQIALLVQLLVDFMPMVLLQIVDVLLLCEEEVKREEWRTTTGLPAG